jgi:hypothetical protein
VLQQVAKGLVLDDDHPLVKARARRGHAAQAAAQCLLGEDLVRRAERSQRDDHADVAHVPSLAQRGHWSQLEGRMPTVTVELAWDHPENLDTVVGA